MANSDINTVITQLGVMALDTTATNSFQDDVIFELSRGAHTGNLGQSGAAFVAITAGTERYSIPTASGARTPLAIIYDDTQLLLLRKDEAWAYDEAWRKSLSDTIVGVVMDPEDRINFSLVPAPLRTGDAISGQTPIAVTAFPSNNVTVVYAASDTTYPGTTYDDFKLPIALEVLAREFGRDSDHHDEGFSQLARVMSTFFFGMTVPKGRPT